MWEGEAQREKIIDWNPFEWQLEPTIHQIRLNPVRITQLEKPRMVAPA